MRPYFIAPVLAAVIATSEVWELADHLPFHHSGADVSLPVTARDLLHNHFDMPDGGIIDVSSPISASGGQEMPDVYRLHLRPHYVEDEIGQLVLRWVDLVGLPTFSLGDQPMYGRCQNIDDVMTLLSAKLHLPDTQLSSIRRDLGRL